MNAPVVLLSGPAFSGTDTLCDAQPVPRVAPLIYLSDRRAIFIGQLPAARRTSLASSRLILCLSGEMYYQLADDGPVQACTSLLLPPGLSIAVDTRKAVIADCYLEVLGRDHAVLRQGALEISHGLYRDIPCQQQLATLLRQLLQDAPPAETFFGLLDPLFEDGFAQTGFHVDSRIERVVERIKRSPRECLPVDVMAAEVGLSSSRLLALFKAQVGIPIRRYRLWRRLYQSTARLSAGCSLTEAAMEAGFADSPHFSRTYLNMIGMQPSLLTRNECGLRIFVDQRPAGHDSPGY
jgi:AraC-like DNA-binding protein